MNREYRESSRQWLIHKLAEEAAKLVNSGQFNERGAVNAAMRMFRGDVLDQGKNLFGPVIAEVRKRVQSPQTSSAQLEKSSVRAVTANDPDFKIMMRDAHRREEELLKGFDGEDRPFESAA